MENLTSSDGGASTTESTTHKSCIDDLGDDLLLEILLRLPTAKHALICSSVCKNWYSLILKNRSFIARFVIQHLIDSSDVVNYNCNLAINNPASPLEPLLLCQNPKFDEIKRLDLSRMWEGSDCVRILSSCHDLVFCIARKEGMYRYFICNFLTMQNIALPAPPDWEVTKYPRFIKHALICQPYCPPRDTQCRFRVLRFRTVRQLHGYGCFPVDMYCSETPHKWDTVYLFHERKCIELLSNLVAYREKLHWFNGTHIVGYDPFNNVGCYGDTSLSFCIQRPPRTQQWYSYSFNGLGICQGRLRYMELGRFYGDEELRVWDLKDYESKEWSVGRRVVISTLSSKSESVSEMLRNWGINILAPHPFDEDIIYLRFNGVIASCNMRTEEVEVVAEFPGRGGLEEYGKLITIPWWPTPI